ncbi:efflux RND transporter periplasmic adaptor subunit [Dyadobacter sediminis]|uniref:Efflux RND transporter periplasmic adaptor subunit n=1 Tax=Dyadobacter sediminis TaxID=1493691 RepID=A0A5R9KDC0_9BACT|nr:efflux RND transporter periplasmic adaptor subunit [Dyadobacter sediminis]TLU94119.1 efflux RND transporter periplasmic adaptor subunit [Dyadobacter sediminis]GGB94060.1 MexH family multidrug efflux RND transporter periplasmic adaptor subunit [Dyadobacter sediminis]
MRTIILVAGIIIVLVLGKLFVFSKPEKNKISDDKKGANGKSLNSGTGSGVPVNVFVVGRESIENQIFASGTVLPNEEVNLMSEISGRLVKLDIQEGSLVSKGQLIAKINDRELQAQLQKVAYNQELSKKIEERQKKLLNVEAINLEEYDVTSNNIRLLKAEQEVIEAQLEKTEIRAPFSGRIGLKYISEGAYLAPGTSIVTIVQSNPVKIDFTVPEKYTPNIKVGNVVKFSLDGDPATYNASIIAIDPKVDENMRTLRVRAVAKNPGGRFVPGMFVKVLADLEANRSAMMIPTEAIVPVLKGKKVFVVKNGKAQEALVTTGLRTDKRIQVIEGLNPGDSLITSGIIAIKPNTAVKVN